MIAGEIEQIIHRDYDRYYDPFFKKRKARRQAKKATKVAPTEGRKIPMIAKMPILPFLALKSGLQNELSKPSNPVLFSEPQESLTAPKRGEVAIKMAGEAIDSVGGMDGLKETAAKAKLAAAAASAEGAPEDYELGLGAANADARTDDEVGGNGTLKTVLIIGGCCMAALGIGLLIAKLSSAPQIVAA